jgi:hypothetical protein
MVKSDQAQPHYEDGVLSIAFPNMESKGLSAYKSAEARDQKVK